MQSYDGFLPVRIEGDHGKTVKAARICREFMALESTLSLHTAGVLIPGTKEDSSIKMVPNWHLSWQVKGRVAASVGHLPSKILL
jgi:hypothetical protein